MRRKDREITDFTKILDIMRQCDVCRLAIHDTPYPYLIPMNFGMDVQDGQVYLYFHSAMQGTKLDLLKKDNRVTFEMDFDHKLLLQKEKMNCTMAYSSVIGHGTMEFLPDEQKLDALNILMRHYHAEDFAFHPQMAKVTTVLRLTVADMTAKRRGTE